MCWFWLDFWIFPLKDNPFKNNPGQEKRGRGVVQSSPPPLHPSQSCSNTDKEKVWKKKNTHWTGSSASVPESKNRQWLIKDAYIPKPITNRYMSELCLLVNKRTKSTRKRCSRSSNWTSRRENWSTKCNAMLNGSLTFSGDLKKKKQIPIKIRVNTGQNCIINYSQWQREFFPLRVQDSKSQDYSRLTHTRH